MTGKKPEAEQENPAEPAPSRRPIMVLLDLLGRRWTLRIIWELRGDRLKFRALQAACGGLSPTVLNERLKELRGQDIVDLTDDGFGMTEAGRELTAHILGMDKWARTWITPPPP